MGPKRIRSEGGSGGKLGHSNMEHWAYTYEIKDAARTRRRIDDKVLVREQNPASLVALDFLDLDMSDVEAKILTSLVAGKNLEVNGQPACEQFAIILVNVLRTLPTARHTKHWDLDDLSCDAVKQSGQVVALRGTSNWLSGGEGCEQFRIDILTQTPLLYSFKFTKTATSEQVLYVGKTPTGWIVNGP